MVRGSPTRARSLAVWMNDVRVGTWSLPAQGPQEFSYDEAWLRSSQFRVLSLSLHAGIGATTLRGSELDSWFDNLTPDSDAIRRRAQARFQASSTRAFDLLPLMQVPCGIDRIEARPLSELEIGQRLHKEGDDLRLSVAGALEKPAFLSHNGQWCLPLGSTPTTHLFKLQIDFSTTVENKWLCSRILQAFGLPGAPSHIASFDGQRCLIVERFDRKLHASGSNWLRLPTEDCC